MKQLLILLVAILVGILISLAAGAQDFHKAKTRYFKAKYKTQLSLAKKECEILDRKRKARPVIADIRKPKWKPKAEIDPPSWAVNSSR